MKQKKVLKKFLQRIRGLKKGDYVRYKYEEGKSWLYGIIQDIEKYKSKEFILVRNFRKGYRGLVILPKDEIYLARRRKKA